MKTAVKYNNEKEYKQLMKAYSKNAWKTSVGTTPSLRAYDKAYMFAQFKDGYGFDYTEVYYDEIISVEEAIKRLEGEDPNCIYGNDDCKICNNKGKKIDITSVKPRYTPAQERAIWEAAVAFTTMTDEGGHLYTIKTAFERAKVMLKEAQERGLLQD